MNNKNNINNKLSTKFLQESELIGFKFEKIRKELLKQKKFKLLKRTYYPDIPVIKGNNSSIFWDKKFSETAVIHPMETDRNHIVGNSVVFGEKILNLGAGRGFLENVVAERKIDLHWTGTDITNKSLTSLRKRFHNFIFQKEELENLSFEDSIFDKVILLEVLEHIEPYKTFNVLKEVKRVLKNSGTFIVSVPINEGLKEMFPRNPNSHVREYSIELLEYELNKNGFSVDKVISLTAFHKNYRIKKLINRMFRLKQSNNLIIFARPR